MVTPVMISSISWGTYLFFAVVNACFIPIIYLFYPETKKRSLEEIDLIFAKGYTENISYVKASFDLPFLTDREVKEMSRQYGFVGKDDEFTVGEKDVTTTTGEARRSNSEKGGRGDSEGTLGAQTATMDHAVHEPNDVQSGGFRND
jgi:hypothetical protein